MIIIDTVILFMKMASHLPASVLAIGSLSASDFGSKAKLLLYVYVCSILFETIGGK